VWQPRRQPPSWCAAPRGERRLPGHTTRLTVELAEEPTDHRIIGSNAGVKATSVRSSPAAVAATGQSRCERRGPVAERLVVVCDVHDTNVVATGHVRLDVAGEVHELDLCDEHLRQLRESLGTLLAPTQSDRPQRAARGPGQGTRGRTGGAKSATARRRRAPSRAGSAGGAGRSASMVNWEAARKWARAHGLSVSDRGRLAADVVRQFEEATGGDSASADGASAVDEAAE
jgi:hypothetical protein